MLVSAASAQEGTPFYEVETNYIFGGFTIGSAVGIESEEALDLAPQADFGKRAGSYVANETEIEYEFMPNAAWGTQVAGQEVGVLSPLDLTDFSRQRARLLFERVAMAPSRW
jgi:hypothetical protein